MRSGPARKPLARSAVRSASSSSPSSASVAPAAGAGVAGCAPASSYRRLSSYAYRSTAWARFTEGCASSVGMAERSWQRCTSSFVSPLRSSPKTIAVLPSGARASASRATSAGTAALAPDAARARPDHPSAVGDRLVERADEPRPVEQVAGVHRHAPRGRESCVPSSAIAQSARPKFFIARATAPRVLGVAWAEQDDPRRRGAGLRSGHDAHRDASSPARSDAARGRTRLDGSAPRPPLARRPREVRWPRRWTMRVGEVMTRNAVTIGVDETLVAAAEDEGARCRRPPRARGRDAHRDLDRSRPCGAGDRLGRGSQTHAGPEAMTAQVVACTEEDDLGEAAHAMEACAVRRLIVLDREGHLRGMLSVEDIANASTVLAAECCVARAIARSRRREPGRTARRASARPAPGATRGCVLRSARARRSLPPPIAFDVAASFLFVVTARSPR